MLAPLLLLWPMSLAVTYLVAKSIANGPFDRALETDAYVLARQIHPVNGVAELSLMKTRINSPGTNMALVSHPLFVCRVLINTAGGCELTTV